MLNNEELEETSEVDYQRLSKYLYCDNLLTINFGLNVLILYIYVVERNENDCTS